MARVTVEDCLEHVTNRFELVVLASRRARQLASFKNDSIPLVERENDKETVIALREIAAGLLNDEEFLKEESDEVVFLRDTDDDHPTQGDETASDG